MYGSCKSFPVPVAFLVDKQILVSEGRPDAGDEDLVRGVAPHPVLADEAHLVGLDLAEAAVLAARDVL